MTITQMRYFATVCHHKNITIAAKSLFISQPALSATLSDIEKEVGFKLFTRKAKGITLTNEACQLLNYVEAVLNRYDIMAQNIPLISNGQNIIRVGFRSYGGENDFFRIYRDFHLCHPDIRLYTTSIPNTPLDVYLDEGQIDFLIGNNTLLSDGWKNKYRCQLLGCEEIQLYCGSLCPLNDLDSVSLKDLSDYPWVFWEGHQLLKNRIENIFSQEGLQLHCAGIVPQQTDILHFVSNNLAIGLLTGDYLDHLPIIRKVPPLEKSAEHLFPPAPEIHVFWKEESEKHSSKKQFINFLKKL